MASQAQGVQTTTAHDPPSGGCAITPNDSANLVTPIRGFIVGSSGNVQCTMSDGSVIVYQSCIAGVIYPGIITKVWATNTGATNITGFF